MRPHLGLAVVTAACLSGLAVADQPKAGTPPREFSDVQDLVFFSDTRPILIRLHVRIDGKPVHEIWHNYVEDLFTYLDGDNDGSLSKDEAGRVPSVQVMQQQLQVGRFLFNRVPNALAGFADLDADQDEKVSLAELLAYYRKGSVGVIRLGQGFGRGFTADALTESIYRHLDVNKDGQLSKDELAQAPALLRKLDLDDDELISDQELTGTFSAYGQGNQFVVQQPRQGQPPVDNSAFFLVTAADTPNALGTRLALGQRIRSRYDRDSNQELSRTEIALDKQSFDQLDGNGNGELDDIELSRWLRRLPDLELLARLGRTAPQELAVETHRTEPAAPMAGSVKQAGDTGVLLSLGDAQIDLRRVDGQPVANNDQLKQFYVQQLKAADPENRGFLEIAKLPQRQMQIFQTFLPMADRNGDGKLTEKELNEFFDLQAKISTVPTVVTITDNGRGLLELFDANRDNRLGVRELRTAWDRLAVYDRGQAGQVARTAIPRQFQVTVSRGQPGFAGRPVVAGPGVVAPGSPAVARRGPLWFRKMDRNGDGDLSPREFLGNLDDFQRMDADNDGLISVEEAERADAALRPAPR